MAVVRIDDELLKQIKEFLEDGGNRYRYPSISSFINNVIYEKLDKLSRPSKKGERR